MSEFLSIGVPAYNEEESIARMLESVFKSTLWEKTPAGLKEVIVCCNGCTDSTAEIVRQILVEHPDGEIKLLETKKGKPNAWNETVKVADKRARIIYFADADVILQKNALEELRTVFRRDDYDLVGARPRPVPMRGVSLSKLVADYRSNNFKRRNWRGSVAGALYGVSRKFAESIHIPESVIQDDVFLEYSAKKVGYAPDAKVFFFPPRTLRGILQQQTRWVAGRKQLKEMGVRAPKKTFAEKGRSLLKRLGSLKGHSLRENIGRAVLHAARMAAKIPARRMLKEAKRNPRGWSSVRSSKIPRRQSPQTRR